MSTSSHPLPLPIPCNFLHIFPAQFLWQRNQKGTKEILELMETKAHQLAFNMQNENSGLKTESTLKVLQANQNPVQL